MSNWHVFRANGNAPPSEPATWTLARHKLSQRSAIEWWGKAGGGLLSIGKSKATIYLEADTAARFDDVAGIDEAKDELREVVEFLKNLQQYGRLGARMPKGVLLVGPSGTGKTLPAKTWPARPRCFLHLRLRVRGNVRRPRRRARTRPVRAGAQVRFNPATRGPGVGFVHRPTFVVALGAEKSVLGASSSALTSFNRVCQTG
jgi:hypothetical protein